MVSMRTDTEGDIDVVSTLRTRAPQEINGAMDRVAATIGDHAKQGIQRQLSAGGHNTTFTAFMSIAVMDKGDGAVDVEAASYLEDLEEGTAPHLPEMTHRLKVWARRNGWSPNALWRHIAMHGTEPNNNFMQKALNPTIKNIEYLAKKAVRRELRGL